MPGFKLAADYIIRLFLTVIIKYKIEFSLDLIVYNLVKGSLVRLLPYRHASVDIAPSAPTYIFTFPGITELWAENLQIIGAFLYLISCWLSYERRW